MSYTKIIIEDLNSSKAENVSNLNSMNVGRALIAEQHKKSKAQPRDESVWTKTSADKKFIKKCKANWKAEMLAKFPDFTNKSDLHNTKAILWT